MFVMTMKKQYNTSENTWSYSEQSSARFSTLFLGTANSRSSHEKT